MRHKINFIIWSSISSSNPKHQLSVACCSFGHNHKILFSVLLRNALSSHSCHALRNASHAHLLVSFVGSLARVDVSPLATFSHVFRRYLSALWLHFWCHFLEPFLGSGLAVLLSLLLSVLELVVFVDPKVGSEIIPETEPKNQIRTASWRCLRRMGWLLARSLASCKKSCLKGICVCR